MEPRLDRLKALYETGKYQEGLRYGDGLLREARALDHAASLAWIMRWHGRLQIETGKYADAEGQFRAALQLAATAQDYDLVVDLLGQLIVSLTRQARHSDIVALEDWANVAAKMVRDDQARARLLAGLGNSYKGIGKYAESQILAERALAIREQTLGPDHPDVAASLNAIAIVDLALSQPNLALSNYERALAIWEHALGPDHPDVAISLLNLGNALESLGRRTEARAANERALAIWEQALGPEHPNVAAALNNLANKLRAAGEYADATALQERAFTIWHKVHGPEHPYLGISLTNQGAMLYSTGHYAEAVAKHEQALVIIEKVLGAEHRHLADVLAKLGRA